MPTALRQGLLAPTVGPTAQRDPASGPARLIRCSCRRRRPGLCAFVVQFGHRRRASAAGHRCLAVISHGGWLGLIWPYISPSLRPTGTFVRGLIRSGKVYRVFQRSNPPGIQSWSALRRTTSPRCLVPQISHRLGRPKWRIPARPAGGLTRRFRGGPGCPGGSAVGEHSAASVAGASAGPFVKGAVHPQHVDGLREAAGDLELTLAGDTMPSCRAAATRSVRLSRPPANRRSPSLIFAATDNGATTASTTSPVHGGWQSCRW